MSTLPHSTSQQELLAQQAFLRRLARSLVADEQRAEDLAQDAALEALRAGPARLGAMRAWLRRVVRNLATDADRRERLRAAREGEATPPAAPLAPDEVAQRLQAQREVLEALERLEEPYKSTLFLRFWDDLGPSDIARRTGVPVATVKTRLARGLARLRAELDLRHGGERKAWAVALIGGLRGAKSAGLGTTAAAVGGLAMGIKLVLASAVVGGAAVGAWWWAARYGAEPLRTQVARAEPAVIETPRAKEPALPVPDADARTAVPMSSSLATLAATAPTQPTTVLSLELRGWLAADAGTLTVTIAPRDGEASVRAERELADSLEIDVSTLFASDEPPRELRVALDHRAYLPAETWALVPSEPAAVPERIPAVIDLVRASAIVTGRVDVPPGTPHESVRVALYGLRGEQLQLPRPVDSADCDVEGRYRLRANAAERHALAAWCAGLDPTRRRALHPSTGHLALGGRDAVELEPLLIDAGARLHGRVVYASGGAPTRGNVLVRPSTAGTSADELVWTAGSFEWGQQQLAIDETGAFEVSGLSRTKYALNFGGGEPEGASACTSHESEVEVQAPNESFELVQYRVLVTVQVQSEGIAVPHALLMASTTSRAACGTGTDENGGARLWIDPRNGVELWLEEQPAFEPRRLVVPPEELTPGVVVLLEVEPARDPAPATLVLQPGGSGRDDLARATVDVVIYKFDERGEIPQSAREWVPRSVGFPYGRVRFSPDIPLARGADGSVVLTDFPPGKYFVRAIPRETNDPPSFVPPADFEVELAPGEHAIRIWEATLGGRLRLNVTGQGQQILGSLLDADGERVPGFEPDALGVSEPVQALDAGHYELRIRLGGGVTRTFPIRIEAGRVNDVAIDLGAP